MPNIFNTVPIIFATYGGTGAIGAHGYPTGSAPYTANVEYLTTEAGIAGRLLPIDFEVIGTWK